MARGWVRTTVGIGCLVLGYGCGGERLLAPAASQVRTSLTPVPAAWRDAAVLERLVLGKLEARYSRYGDPRDAARISSSREMIALLDRDSISQEVALAHRTLAAPVVRRDSLGREGMPLDVPTASMKRFGSAVSSMQQFSRSDIDPNASYTKFYPPNPNIEIQTTTSGANWISERSAGSWTKFDVTWPINQSLKAPIVDVTNVCEAILNAGGNPDNYVNLPNGLCVLPRYSLSDAILLPLDCSRAGLTMSVTTDHRSGIAVPTGWDFQPLQEMQFGQLTTYASDNGECPRVAPTARFVMTGNGAVGGDQSPLNLPAPGVVSFSATGFERDAQIVTFGWTVGGVSSEGYTSSANVGVGAWGVTLTLTDALGKTGRAESTILVSPVDPNPVDSGGSTGPYPWSSYTPPPPSHGYTCVTSIVWVEVVGYWGLAMVGEPLTNCYSW
jgi:hypothetical protein